MLDEVSDEVWRADDVLGWVYEYYNRKLLDDLREKGDRVGLDPEDVPPANQFYTPHWVVRMLTDNSLGNSTSNTPASCRTSSKHSRTSLPMSERTDRFRPTNRQILPISVPISSHLKKKVSRLTSSTRRNYASSTQLVGVDTSYCTPSTCWSESGAPRPTFPRGDSAEDSATQPLRRRPRHACLPAGSVQSVFEGTNPNRAEGADGFDMPRSALSVRTRRSPISTASKRYSTKSPATTRRSDALRRILDAFEEVHGLRSLLDVRGTLGDLFEDDSDVGVRSSPSATTHERTHARASPTQST